MTRSEFYAACIAVSFLALVWTFFGGPIALVCIAAMLVGQCDVGWADTVGEQRHAEPQPNAVDVPVAAEPIPDVDAGVADRVVTQPVKRYKRKVDPSKFIKGEGGRFHPINERLIAEERGEIEREAKVIRLKARRAS